MSTLFVDTINEKTSGNGIYIPGHVIQVVQGESTAVTSFTNSTSWTDLGVSASITPTSTSSKILVIVDVKMGNLEAGLNFSCRLLRGSTAIGGGVQSANRQAFSHNEMSIVGTQYQMRPQNLTFLDSPSTTSATTYKVQTIMNATGGTVYLNRSHNNSSAQANTRSTITLMEIGG